MEKFVEITYLMFTDMFMGKMILYKGVEIPKWQAYAFFKYRVDECFDLYLNQHDKFKAVDKDGWLNGIFININSN